MNVFCLPAGLMHAEKHAMEALYTGTAGRVFGSEVRAISLAIRRRTALQPAGAQSCNPPAQRFDAQKDADVLIPRTGCR